MGEPPREQRLRRRREQTDEVLERLRQRYLREIAEIELVQKERAEETDK